MDHLDPFLKESTAEGAPGSAPATATATAAVSGTAPTTAVTISVAVSGRGIAAVFKYSLKGCKNQIRRPSGHRS